MHDDNIDPDVEVALEERVEWINGVTELAAEDDWQGVQTAIDQLDDEHLRSVVYVLIMARSGDAQRLHDLVANWNSAPLN